MSLSVVYKCLSGMERKTKQVKMKQTKQVKMKQTKQVKIKQTKQVKIKQTPKQGIEQYDPQTFITLKIVLHFTFNTHIIVCTN